MFPPAGPEPPPLILKRLVHPLVSHMGPSSLVASNVIYEALSLSLSLSRSISLSLRLSHSFLWLISINTSYYAAYALLPTTTFYFLLNEVDSTQTRGDLSRVRKSGTGERRGREEEERSCWHAGEILF